MATPIILINGQAGCGKDTVAAMIKQYTHNTVCIAQADPMKRFAARVFGFSEHQLWGPSEARNALDERFKSIEAWNEAALALSEHSTYEWVVDSLGTHQEASSGVIQLERWFADLAKEHGFALIKKKQEHGGWEREVFAVIPAGVPKRVITPRYVLQTLGTEWGRDFSRDMWVNYAIRTAHTLLGGGVDYDRTKGVFKAEHGMPDFVVITDGRFVNEIVTIKREGAIAINVVNPVDTDEAMKVEVAGVKGHRSEAELKMIPGHYFDIELRNDKRQGLLTLENKIVKLVQHLKYTEQF